MSNVINFLVRMGQDAQLRHASSHEVALALASEQIDPELRAAILAKDQREIERLLEQAPHCCLLFPEKEDEDDDGEEGPSREGEEISMHSVFRNLASVA
jgi:molybdopterin-guanine dinucleotide biosynthesis protein A